MFVRVNPWLLPCRGAGDAVAQFLIWTTAATEGNMMPFVHVPKGVGRRGRAGRGRKSEKRRVVDQKTSARWSHGFTRVNADQAEGQSRKLVALTLPSPGGRGESVPTFRPPNSALAFTPSPCPLPEGEGNHARSAFTGVHLWFRPQPRRRVSASDRGLAIGGFPVFLEAHQFEVAQRGAEVGEIA